MLRSIFRRCAGASPEAWAVAGALVGALAAVLFARGEDEPQVARWTAPVPVAMSPGVEGSADVAVPAMIAAVAAKSEEPRPDQRPSPDTAIRKETPLPFDCENNINRYNREFYNPKTNAYRRVEILAMLQSVSVQPSASDGCAWSREDVVSLWMPTIHQSALEMKQKIADNTHDYEENIRRAQQLGMILHWGKNTEKNDPVAAAMVPVEVVAGITESQAYELARVFERALIPSKIARMGELYKSFMGAKTEGRGAEWQPYREYMGLVEFVIINQNSMSGDMVETTNRMMDNMRRAGVHGFKP